MPKQKIYLDYAATTPVDGKVFQAMQPYFSKIFGNASSLHLFGQAALKGVDEARETVASFLGAEPREIIFTSGATEANNLAIRGVFEAIKAKYPKQKEGGWHLITSSIEHPAVLETCQALEKKGVKVTYLPVTKGGLVELAAVEKAIRPETFLATIMYVNNEVGTIQPIREIGKLIERVNKERLKEKLPKIIFHTDATQAVNYCPCNVQWLHVDLLSFSGHKIYGPKGIGVLYLKKGTSIKSIQTGGHHEFAVRAGTLNVPGIVGLGEAVKLVQKNQPAENKRLAKLSSLLIDGVLKKIPQSRLNGDREKRVPANVNFTFKDVEGESILLRLDLEGVAVSTGSACASGSLEPSHVLRAMKVPIERIHGSIRITLGRPTAPAEIKKVLNLLPKVIKDLRKISPKS